MKNVKRMVCGNETKFTRIQCLFGGISVLFLFVIADGILNGRCQFVHYQAAVLATITVLLCAAVFCAAHFVKKLSQPKPRTEKILAAVLLTLYFAFLLYAGFSMRVYITGKWDFGVVLGSAENYVTSGDLLPTYYTWFYNNAPLYLFFVGVFNTAKLFGITNFYACAIVLNCLAITVSVLLLYFVLRKLLGVNAALFGTVCAGLCVGLFGYAPIVYSDTLSMPFPILCVLLWLYARDAFAGGNMRRGALLCALLGVAAGLGGKLKITVLIVAVAILIDACILPALRAKLCAVAAVAVPLCLVYVLLSAAVANSPALLPRDKEDAIPYTHWVMMGLNGDGNYCDDDYQATLAAGNYEQRVDYTVEQIQNRVLAYGVGGMAAHIADKLAFTWGDGTFYAPVKLNQGPFTYSVLHHFLLFNAKLFPYASYLFTGIHLAALLCVAVGAWMAFRRGTHVWAFIPLAVFGLLLFLLLWETRRRYLVNYIPLLAVCAIQGLFVHGAKKDAANNLQP